MCCRDVLCLTSEMCDTSITNIHQVRLRMFDYDSARMWRISSSAQRTTTDGSPSELPCRTHRSELGIC